MDSKKKSSEKYYDIEKWNLENPETLLKSEREKYLKVKKDTEDLTQQAMDLKESHENGAIDSINRASKMSNEASTLMDSVEAKVNSELKPLINSLKQKLELSKESFEKSDKQLEEFFDGIHKNLSNSLNGIFNLNQAVCGEITSEKEKCSQQCGGALCDGKCGTNTSSCTGLADSYHNLLNIRNKFDELYANHEMTFKKILTKVNL